MQLPVEEEWVEWMSGRTSAVLLFGINSIATFSPRMDNELSPTPAGKVKDPPVTKSR